MSATPFSSVHFDRLFKLVGAFFTTLLLSISANAATGFATNDKNVAIDGFDTVAYFEQKRSIRGKEGFKTEYEGVNWLFSSAENLALFKENPEKYVPQYGGYCAYAMAKGQLAVGKGRQWRIVDDKLYLNFSSKIKKRWDKKHKRFITEADTKWASSEY